MMVSVVIGLVLTVAVLYLQLKLTTQNVRTSDTAVRDNEARAAMDLITRDLSGGGFLHAGAASNCYAVLNYNSAVPSPGYFAGFAVSALTAGAGVALPFVASPGISLNYPASGNSNRSDVLVVRSTQDASQLAATVSPIVPTMDNTSFSPMMTTQLPFAVSPALPFSPNDMALVQVPVGTPPNTQLMCLRIPISPASVVVNGSAYVSSGGSLMPAAGYTGFATQFAGIGLSGALSDPLLRSSKVMGLGQAGATNQATYAYFIDKSSTSTWPTLMRATINAMNDQEVGTRQAIAAGVVSFQVLFGVGTAAGGVTAYQTWAQVLAAGNAGNVMTVKVMILQRSLYPDKDYTNPAATISLNSQFNQTTYTDYVIPASEMSNRFIAQEVEMTVRSASPLWPK